MKKFIISCLVNLQGRFLHNFTSIYIQQDTPSIILSLRRSFKSWWKRWKMTSFCSSTLSIHTWSSVGTVKYIKTFTKIWTSVLYVHWRRKLIIWIHNSRILFLTTCIFYFWSRSSYKQLLVMNVESSSASFNSDCDAKWTLPFHQHPYRSYTMYIHYYNVYLS